MYAISNKFRKSVLLILEQSADSAATPKWKKPKIGGYSRLTKKYLIFDFFFKKKKKNFQHLILYATGNHFCSSDQT
jgi:hypothetical protein